MQQFTRFHNLPPQITNYSTQH